MTTALLPRRTGCGKNKEGRKKRKRVRGEREIGMEIEREVIMLLFIGFSETISGKQKCPVSVSVFSISQYNVYIDNNIYKD